MRRTRRGRRGRAGHRGRPPGAARPGPARRRPPGPRGRGRPGPARVAASSEWRPRPPHAQRRAETTELRTALLSAVGHDLRTPLTSIKAAVSSLRDPELRLSEEDTGELLATVEESADRLAGLVDNLLDSSRLATGAVEPQLRPVGLLRDRGPAPCPASTTAEPRRGRRRRAPAAGAGRRRAARTRAWPTSSTTPCATAATADPASPPSRSGQRAAAGSNCGSSTRAPACPRAPGRAVRAVPAARRPGRHHRRRTGVERGEGVHRGHGRRDPRRGHPRRRPDRGDRVAGRRRPPPSEQAPMIQTMPGANR